MDSEQFQKIKTAQGFIAALDQSGGSTPKALRLYGIDESAYSNDAEMFDRIHEMRTRWPGAGVDRCGRLQQPQPVLSPVGESRRQGRVRVNRAQDAGRRGPDPFGGGTQRPARIVGRVGSAGDVGERAAGGVHAVAQRCCTAAGR